MKLSRYFISLFILVAFGLFYVHQQFILLNIRYTNGKYEHKLSHLLDHNRELRYNVNILRSPAKLEAKLTAAGLDYGMPVYWTVVKIPKRPTYELASTAPRRNTIIENILNFLTVKAEAQSVGK